MKQRPRPMLEAALIAALIAAPTNANADDPHIEGAHASAPTAPASLTRLCGDRTQKECRQLLERRLEEIRTMIETRRRAAPPPKLDEALGLAANVVITSPGDEGMSPFSERLAWLGNRHRWTWPIPPELEDAVAQAWSAVKARRAERDVLSDAAMTLGHRDALDHLVRRLGERWFHDQPPPEWILRRHTDATGSLDELKAWFADHADELRFDPFLRRWRLASPSTQGARAEVGAPPVNRTP